ncbi:pepsin/retropepsin-like aspartic protease family protein [uncultured Winogradskyella sp.]|uniref:pepsin/retropepsin-like aspartic protease family protein n=1 Tax=uncultured Winogradskyella sp. TaxID=395353 RepID=UPI002618CD8A|nr:pepsin/retropepsin-like aspartic protease family protein [uncultured Winogradskyella sp.]|tara:strand:+ start:11052 stop:12011 length:960 start_codon:yes stop_codon:yes gene_type:complete
MHQSIKIIFALFISVKLYATDYKPPIVFSKAEFVNTSTTRIPFKVIDQLIVVEVELLDKEGNFIIDTGSETLILNSVHYKASRSYRSNTKQRSGVHIEIEDVVEKHLQKLSLEDFRLENLNADVIDLSHIEKIKKIEVLGIIGFSVLKDFEIFIDMHLNQITLTKTDKNGERLSQKVYAETIHDSIDFKLKKHTIIIDAQIENKQVKFGLDTGAEYNQLNKNIDSEILDYFYPSKELKLTGASGKKLKVMAGKLYRVRLNDSIYFGPMKTVLTNLRQMNSAFGTNLDGILGFEFFAQQRTIINYKKQKLYFIKFPIIKP